MPLVAATHALYAANQDIDRRCRIPNAEHCSARVNGACAKDISIIAPGAGARPQRCGRRHGLRGQRRRRCPDAQRFHNHPIRAADLGDAGVPAISTAPASRTDSELPGHLAAPPFAVGGAPEDVVVIRGPHWSLVSSNLERDRLRLDPMTGPRQSLDCTRGRSRVRVLPPPFDGVHPQPAVVLGRGSMPDILTGDVGTVRQLELCGKRLGHHKGRREE
jgi:hypothetical protein